MANVKENTADLRYRGALYAIVAAVLFGISAPIAKLLLPGAGFLMLASLLYLGAGVGLSLIVLMRRGRREASLQRSDFLPIAGIIVAGGIVGPILLLYGLQSVSGVVGSLLLNLEAPFTMILAVLVFREHMNRTEMIAAVLIIGGAVILSYVPGQLRAEVVGALAIAGACLAWAIDNNLTQKVSLRDPMAIVRVKTLGAGLCTMIIALTAGERFPSRMHVVSGLVLGFFSYGASIVFAVYALRILGAAREAAFFATAPFIGALLSIPLLHESITPFRATGLALMIIGVTALVRARHTHLHTHEAIVHDHVHIHDQHHQHAHSASDPAGEPHAHPHRHEPITHEHPHVSDAHHRHPH